MYFPANKHQKNVDPRNSIVFFGELWDVGRRVKKWYERGGFDGYNKKKSVVTYEDRKTGKTKKKVIRGKRYGGRFPRPGRGVKAIKQGLIHHTGGYLPGVCFNTLHNNRKLSVQFIVDDWGTIYQTMDVKEIAWHGGKQNRSSFGIECCLRPDAVANPEAYREAKCNRFNLAPHKVGRCYIQGRWRSVFIMPDHQVDALARLLAVTWFARDIALGKYAFMSGETMIAPKFPERVTGMDEIVVPDMDFRKEYRKHEGLVMHSNVSKKKWDAAGLNAEFLEDRVSDLYNAQKIRG